MADVRIQMPIKIVDPTTNANEATVSAAGNLNVAVNLALPAGTNNIGDVDVLSIVPGTGATNLGKAEDAAHTSADVGVGSLAVRQDTPGNLSGADGDYEFLQMSGGRLHVSLGTGTVGGAASLPAGTNNIGDVDVLTVVTGTGATNLGKAEDAAHTTGDVGVMILAVRNDANAVLAGADLDYTPLAVDSSGNLQVDVLTGGGADTPTTPTRSSQTSASLAAGSSATLATGEIGTKKLWQVDIASSVSWKAVVSTVENAVVTTQATLFGGAGESYSWKPPHRNFAAITASAGLDEFRCVMTNLDTSEAADVFSTFHYSDA